MGSAILGVSPSLLPWGQPLTLDTLERKEESDRCEWSGHRDYAGPRRAAGCLSLEWLRFWGRSEWEAQRGYRQAMAAGRHIGGESLGGFAGEPGAGYGGVVGQGSAAANGEVARRGVKCQGLTPSWVAKRGRKPGGAIG